MEGRNIEVKIISAKDLKKVSLFGSLHAYAVAWIDPRDKRFTSVDEDGGSKPKWKQSFTFLVPESLLNQPHTRLTVEIFSKGTFSGDTFVGGTAVALADLAAKTEQGEKKAYQLVRKSGKQKGTLKLAIRVGEKTTIETAVPPPAVPPEHKAYASDAAMPYGYPPPYGAGAPPPAAVPYGYPPAPAGYPSYGAPMGYPQQPPPPNYYAAQPPPNRRPGGGLGMGLGAGLLAGAVGGLIVGDIVDDAFDGGDGGFDGGGFDF
ncbi:hypothetical protein KP509_04G043800 [Ceratopteris richardii]|uniref:C2 domain-containing protein n=1 Tax=Ceratopteris richardii TaxID=49495 RepID=A0A8T2UWG1_CERRI|nr:hypothetical protein KP509_04G043800 [Ceratopteris richardii]